MTGCWLHERCNPCSSMTVTNEPEMLAGRPKRNRAADLDEPPHSMVAIRNDRPHRQYIRQRKLPQPVLALEDNALEPALKRKTAGTGRIACQKNVLSSQHRVRLPLPPGLFHGRRGGATSAEKIHRQQVCMAHKRGNERRLRPVVDSVGRIHLL